MDRRSFFGAIALAAVSPGALAVLPGRRVSIVTGDPGERLYGQACADGKSVKVYCDGVLQTEAITADEAAGFVDRHFVGDSGHIAFNRVTGEILQERVHGRVKIEIS